MTSPKPLFPTSTELVQSFVCLFFPSTIHNNSMKYSGRAGRAGRPGEAITYFTKDDAEYLRSIANVMQASGCDVPEWMLTLKKPTKEMKKRLKMKPLERESISTMSTYDAKKIQHKKEVVEKSKQKGEWQKNRQHDEPRKSKGKPDNSKGPRRVGKNQRDQKN